MRNPHAHAGKRRTTHRKEITCYSGLRTTMHLGQRIGEYRASRGYVPFVIRAVVGNVKPGCLLSKAVKCFIRGISAILLQEARTLWP